MKRYNIFLFISAFLVLLICLLINIVVDPAWYLCRTNYFNTIKYPFDTRVQKTNYLMHTGEKYTGLLLGSSRVTQMFNMTDIFNYGVGAIYPEEYSGYIEGALRRHDIRTVYIGLDFFGTARTRFSFATQKSPGVYFDGALNPLRVMGSFLSADNIRYALKTADMSVRGRSEGDYFDALFLKQAGPAGAMRMEEVVYRQLLLYHEQCYGQGYAWNPALPEIFRSLKRQYPDVRFVVFTTPISGPLFSLLVHDGRLPDYERWIRLVVQVFGSLYDFMGLNSVTTHLENYSDAHHFTHTIAVRMAQRLVGQPEGIPSDFGIQVTPDNLEQHLANIRQQAKNAIPDPLATYARLAGPLSNVAHDGAATSR